MKEPQILEGQVCNLYLHQYVMVCMRVEKTKCVYILQRGVPFEITRVRLYSVEQRSRQGLDGLILAATRYSVMIVEVDPYSVRISLNESSGTADNG